MGEWGRERERAKESIAVKLSSAIRLRLFFA